MEFDKQDFIVANVIIIDIVVNDSTIKIYRVVYMFLTKPMTISYLTAFTRCVLTLAFSSNSHGDFPVMTFLIFCLSILF